MKTTPCRFDIVCVMFVLCALAAVSASADQMPTDWDLYMMRLVNRARTDPAGEDALQGTAYGETVVAPLAYDGLVGEAAMNHSDWMGLNRNNLDINDPTNTGPAPDSFTHHETLNAQSGGAPAVGTPGYTGFSIGERVTFTGFQWSRVGENILWRSDTPTIDAAQIDINHAGWWNSAGHRDNMMLGDVALFGHHARNDDDHWATQVFAMRGSWDAAPQTNIFGVLFDDLDDSGDWSPRNAGDPLHEGLAGVAFSIVPDGGGPVAATGTTWDNGSYTAAVADGLYDVIFTDPGLPGGEVRVEDVLVNGFNVNAGDTAVPEPTTLTLLAVGLLAFRRRRRRRTAA